jgi:hypothetical protein
MFRKESYPMRLLITAAIGSSLLLTGCSVPAPTTPTESSATASSGVADRQASLRGSRVCFLKTGNGAVTVNPSPNVASNPKMLSGEGGATTDRERCFTGYNAYQDKVTTLSTSGYDFEDVVVDVSSPAGSIRMFATNIVLGAPEFGFDVDFSKPPTLRDGRVLSMSERTKQSFTYKGFKFNVERHGDSSDFKEFLVTFITPAN